MQEFYFILLQTGEPLKTKTFVNKTQTDRTETNTKMLMNENKTDRTETKTISSKWYKKIKL